MKRLYVIDADRGFVQYFENLLFKQSEEYKMLGHSFKANDFFTKIQEKPDLLNKIDLLFVNPKLNDLNGLELVKKVKGYRPDVNICILLNENIKNFFINDISELGLEQVIIYPNDDMYFLNKIHECFSSKTIETQSSPNETSESISEEDTFKYLNSKKFLSQFDFDSLSNSVLQSNSAFETTTDVNTKSIEEIANLNSNNITATSGIELPQYNSNYTESTKTQENNSLSTFESNKYDNNRLNPFGNIQNSEGNQTNTTQDNTMAHSNYITETQNPFNSDSLDLSAFGVNSQTTVESFSEANSTTFTNIPEDRASNGFLSNNSESITTPSFSNNNTSNAFNNDTLNTASYLNSNTFDMFDNKNTNPTYQNNTFAKEEITFNNQSENNTEYKDFNNQDYSKHNTFDVFGSNNTDVSNIQSNFNSNQNTYSNQFETITNNNIANSKHQKDTSFGTFNSNKGNSDNNAPFSNTNNTFGANSNEYNNFAANTLNNNHTPVYPNQSNNNQSEIQNIYNQTGADNLTYEPSSFGKDDNYTPISHETINKVDAIPDFAKQVVSFYSTKGGIGKTSLAVNTTIQLAKYTKKKICLIDFDLTNANVHTHLGILDSTYDLSVISNFDSDIDSLSLSRIVTPYRVKDRNGATVSFDVIVGFKEMRMSQRFTEEEVHKILTILEDMYDIVIVDTHPVYTDPAVSTILKKATKIIFVAEQELTALNGAKDFILTCKRYGIPPEKLFMVLNKYKPKTPIVNKNRLEKSLAKDIFATVPFNMDTMRNAVNTNKPVTIAEPDSDIARAYIDIARIIEKNIVIEESNKGFFSFIKK